MRNDPVLAIEASRGLRGHYTVGTGAIMDVKAAPWRSGAVCSAVQAGVTVPYIMAQCMGGLFIAGPVRPARFGQFDVGCDQPSAGPSNLGP
jgi:hypothetical protein